MRIEGLKNWFLGLLLVSGATTFAQTGDEITTAINKEDYAKAKSLCSQWMAKDPKSGDPYYYLGEIYYENEKTDSAAIMYGKGLTVNEDSWLCLIGQAKGLMDQKKDADAQKLIDKVIRKTRDKNAFAHYQIARAYLNSANANPDKAIERLTRSLEIDSKVSSYYTLMGDAFVAKKEPGKAVSQYEFASDKNKKDPDNYVKRARIWKNGKVWNEAEKSLNECLAIDANYAPAIKELTEVYSRGGQRSKVIPLLKRYNELVGNDQDSRMRYIRYLCGYAEDFETAITEADKFIAQNPKNIEPYRWLAWANAKLGLKAKEEKADSAKIANYFKKGISNSQKFLAEHGEKKLYSSDYDNYITSAVETKDFATVEKIYPELLKMDSTRTEFFDKIARYYYDTKNYDKAVPAYKAKMEKLKKETATDYSFIGLSYKAQKNYPEADKAFAKAAELNPKYIYAFAQRALIEELQDPDFAKGLAKPHYEKIVELGAAEADKNKKDLIKAYNYLGIYAVKLGNDNAGSLAYFQKTLAIDPANATALDAVGKLQGASAPVPPTPIIAPKN
jgi:tetratricopeptide (TPR) repeat protein